VKSILLFILIFTCSCESISRAPSSRKEDLEAQQLVEQEILHRIQFQETIAKVSKRREFLEIAEKANSVDFSSGKLDPEIGASTRLYLDEVLSIYEDTHKWPVGLKGKILNAISVDKLNLWLAQMLPTIKKYARLEGFSFTFFYMIDKAIKRTIPPLMLVNGYSVLLSGISAYLPYRKLSSFLWDKSLGSIRVYKIKDAFGGLRSYQNYLSLNREVSKELNVLHENNRIIFLRSTEDFVETVTVSVNSFNKKMVERLLIYLDWNPSWLMDRSGLSFELLKHYCLVNNISVEDVQEISNHNYLTQDKRITELLSRIFESGNERDIASIKARFSSSFDHVNKSLINYGLMDWYIKMMKATKSSEIRLLLDEVPEGTRVGTMIALWEEAFLPRWASTLDINFFEFRSFSTDFALIVAEDYRSQMEDKVWTTEWRERFKSYLSNSAESNRIDCGYLLKSLFSI
jgi:hypothetical protein